MKFKLLTATILFSFSLSNLLAQVEQVKVRTHEIGIQTDNDSYLGQGSDQYYTNGIFIYYRQALSINNPSATRLANRVLGIELGQKMYNPQSGSVPDKEFIDRPFAAYLYAGANLNLLYKNESNLKISLQTGIIGPAALGAEAQNLIHNTFGFYTLQGWHYQVKNSFQLNFSGEYNKLLARAKWIDVSGSTYANIGTGFIGAGIGPLLRVGNFNALYNSVSTQSTASKVGLTPLHQHEVFLYYKPMYNYIGYDATVQGNIFKHTAGDEVTGTPEHSVFSQQIGVAYSGSRWVLDAGAVIHSRDVTRMVRTHKWGTVTLLYRFK
ncbi:lipid A deacylase LpxR family protein [Mucilaginibacter robiniae]|uniref:Lipid A deacylase LpxR family protein n=1 Tax=Mucilaginibacter robiniae TaxID=2728022 RepID=A0A7L5DUK7_9SPHI|nr:lipid A deacylase LpxR family protein [Mucilaginibacter robiniae]QJD94805.1 lipid A deacylase LpxR family protein [Mucilaginibacter robiniae]